MSCAAGLFVQLQELEMKTSTKISDEIRSLFTNINILVNEYLKEKKDSSDSNGGKIKERAFDEEVIVMSNTDTACCLSDLNPQENNILELRESQIDGFPYLAPIFPEIHDENSNRNGILYCDDEESNVSCYDGKENDIVSNDEELVNSIDENLTPTNQNVNVNPVISIETALIHDDRLDSSKCFCSMGHCDAAPSMRRKSNLNCAVKKKNRISPIFKSKYQCIKCGYGTNSGSNYVRHYKNHIDGLSSLLSINGVVMQ